MELEDIQDVMEHVISVKSENEAVFVCETLFHLAYFLQQLKA
jgi:hypothetical protein